MCWALDASQKTSLTHLAQRVADFRERDGRNAVLEQRHQPAVEQQPHTDGAADDVAQVAGAPALGQLLQGGLALVHGGGQHGSVAGEQLRAADLSAQETRFVGIAVG